MVAAAAEHAFELERLKAQIAQSKVRSEVAEDALLPELNAKAWLEVRGLGRGGVDDAFGMLGRAEAVSGFVGLELVLPFDRTQERAQAERAALAVRTVEAQLRGAEQLVEARAMTTLESLRSAREQLALAEETAKIADEAAVGHEARFDAGLTTSLELVTAQNERRRAELRVAKARADVAKAEVALDHLTGRLLVVLGQMV